MRIHRSVPRTHTSTSRVGRIGSSSERVLDTGARGGCCTRALFVPGRRKVLQPCRSAHTPSIVRVRILESSLATPTHRPVLRGLRARRLEGALARCSHTRPREAHWASTHVPRHGTARRRRQGTTPSRSGLGEYSEGDSRAVRQSCALGSGAGTRGRRRLGYGTRYSNGSRSGVRLPHYPQGYWEGTRGVLMGTCVERPARGSGKGPCAALATGTHRARARKGVLRTVPSTPRRCATAGVLPEYSQPRAARARARQCDGACGRTQGR
jgi:hypothetical protein